MLNCTYGLRGRGGVGRGDPYGYGTVVTHSTEILLQCWIIAAVPIPKHEQQQQPTCVKTNTVVQEKKRCEKEMYK